MNVSKVSPKMAMAPKAAKAPVARAIASKGFMGARVQQRVGAQRVTYRTVTSASYGKEEVGDFPSMDYRIFFKDGDKKVSPWHDIPLYNDDGTVNMIVEIPKESQAKMEVATDEELTPIKQDTKKGKLRDYPYNINWNYGMLPKTWEDPAVKNPEVEDMAGDNDPVDVVEIGSTQHPMGTVIAVKPVGIYAMIDDGELDWKVVAIDVNDPKAADINDVEDVEAAFPGTLAKILEWFRDYKIPDGKGANKFGLDEKCMNKEYTMMVIKETEEFYNKLMSGERKNDEGLSLK